MSNKNITDAITRESCHGRMGGIRFDKMNAKDKKRARYQLIVDTRETTIKSFGEMFLPQRIAEDIEFWGSAASSRPLLLYGNGGNGKTTTAKILSLIYANPIDVMYRDFSMLTDAQSEVDDIESFIANGWTLLHAEEGYQQKHPDVEKFVILDEFHNIGNVTSIDKFKGLLCGDYLRQKKTKMVICCNTTKDKPLQKILTQPILSRCQRLCFNLYTEEVQEVSNKVLEKYPFLDINQVKSILPDYRQLALYIEKETFRRGV